MTNAFVNRPHRYLLFLLLNLLNIHFRDFINRKVMPAGVTST